MKPIIYPYKLGSESARALASALETKQVKAAGTYKYLPNHFIVNWGNSTLPNWNTDEVIWANPPEAVGVAQNKLKTFEVFLEEEISHPSWTTEKSGLNVPEKTYLARKLLNSHSGKGIEIINGTEIPEAPLYVEYIKKIAEFRVHVVCGKVIDFQEKRKTTGWKENPQYSSLIRNKHTGWVYCRSEASLDDRCAELACRAVSALNLDFGAVDIIYNQAKDKFFVLEVNTAPGIEGTTLQSYVNAFKGI